VLEFDMLGVAGKLVKNVIHFFKRKFGKFLFLFLQDAQTKNKNN
jgi:hypothetical protein